ncbi:hypothetical protein SLAV_15760 [Streptomyces lavendulae subsp. lavendulae]|uniref:Uncharacterized protein n=1 Tax=Streptomyces lavendulae subsp. lavendulae TaxID=58340 RepID=A0A2K8PE27_STRLA|nr:hypothetical protein SLAV_15760 [Streptomyces lavendulae subsp. lavendulae]
MAHPARPLGAPAQDLKRGTGRPGNAVGPVLRSVREDGADACAGCRI